MTQPPLLTLDDLEVRFALRGQGRAAPSVRAVDGVTLSLAAGRTLALVGESGCGKSTTAYATLGLTPVFAGRIGFEGRDITRASPAERRELAGAMQIVFQDPQAALDPKMTLGDSIAEPLAIRRVAASKRARRVDALLDLVGLPQSLARRFPNEISGGQRQRVVIARSLALRPKLLICDEPVSALDVSVRSQILNLLMRLQAELGLAYLFISHDLSVVRHIADEVAVMYLGRIVEQGETGALFQSARHPYTEALLSAIPLPDPVAQRSRPKTILSGDLPSPLATPVGCAFALRCPLRIARCDVERPRLVPSAATSVACHVRAPHVA